MRKRRPIAGSGDAGGLPASKRSFDESDPTETEDLREESRAAAGAPFALAAVPEPPPPRPLSVCGDPDCSVGRGYRSRRYW